MSHIKQRHSSKETIFLWNVAGTIYAFVIVSFGLATSLYFAIDSSQQSIANANSFHGAFFISLHSSGILVAAGLLAYVGYFRRSKYHVQLGGTSSRERCSEGNNDDVEAAAATDAEASADANSVSLPYVSLVGPGFNFYLLAGLSLFSLASVALCIVRVIIVTDCRAGSWQQLASAAYVLQAAFILVQTATILLLHRAIFLRHKPLCKMALAHLFTVNLCSWCHSAVAEVKEHIVRKTSTVTSSANNNSSINQSTTAASVPVDCSDASSVHGGGAGGDSTDAATFLAPGLVEFSLLCAPMLLQLLSLVGDYGFALSAEARHHRVDVSPNKSQPVDVGVGTADPPPTADKELPAPAPAPAPANSHGHRRRLMWHQLLGLALSAVLVAATVGCIVLVYRIELQYVCALMYTSQELLLNLLGIGLVVALRFRLKRLSFARGEKHSFDNRLLLVTLFGTLSYNLIGVCFLIDHAASYNSVLAALDIANCILGILQSCMQTAVLLDGLRRRTTRLEHQQQNSRPGRSLVAVLIGLNLALWIIETFEQKKVESVFDYDAIPGFSAVAYEIVQHTGLPFSILYRFHSSVCYSVIWTSAYHLHLPPLY